MPKRVLLTGIGGFIGAHAFQYFLETTDWEIVGIDSFRHKGTCRRLEDTVNDFSRVKIYRHDLTTPIDHQLENLILERSIDDRGKIIEKKVDYIINMASDSAVERSTTDPVACLRNNHELQINMLELARRLKPEKFLHVSSDEVYGEAKDKGGHKEWSTILPSNPYASSKAAQECLAIAYWRTYDVPVIITNCMNIIAERQDPEKFLPKIIQYIVTGQELSIYADNEDNIGSRVYLHARNKADALVFILRLPVSLYSKGAERPDRYNICGEDELNNLELAKLVAEIIGKPLRYRLVPSESARPGYDRRYMLDGTKLRELGWTPPIGFRESIERIVDYTLEHPHWLL